MTPFPSATALPVFAIEGKLFCRVSCAEGTQNPGAIRATLPGKDGKVAWFVAVDATTLSTMAVATISVDEV